MTIEWWEPDHAGCELAEPHGRLPSAQSDGHGSRGRDSQIGVRTAPGLAGLRGALMACGIVVVCTLGFATAEAGFGPASGSRSAMATRASAPFLLGIEDNAQIVGNSAAVVPDIEALAPRVFRFTIFWSEVARRRPSQARNSDDPAYDWSQVDGVVTRLRSMNIPVLLTIVSTPRWAGGGRKGFRAPKRMLDLQNFAYAAADRYNGEHVDAAGAALPRVVRWEAWNEPNLQTNLLPQWTAIGRKRVMGDPFCLGKSWVPASPRLYRGILNAIFRGVHAAGAAVRVKETVAGGATAPYGRGPCAAVPGFAPLAFLRALVERPVSLDVWSHHPYRNGRQNAKAYTGDNIDVQGMPRLYTALDKAFPRRKVLVWVSEFGAQTNPPDKWQGVTVRQQAKRLREAVTTFMNSGRVKMLVWFLLRDEEIAGRPFGGGFQSGLEFANGRRKPSFSVFTSLAAR